MSRKTYPKFSKRRVNIAGENVRLGTQTKEDEEVIENWRASHNHVLNTWQANLRKRIEEKKTIFAQRLKRKNTIFDKLKRHPRMKLSRMHDVAGCRLIFEDMDELINYRRNLLKNARFKHKLKNSYDYVRCPKVDGYRGLHDIYLYKASRSGGAPWNSLSVEIQYRTVYQHAWATAVEVAGHLTGNYTKFGQGDDLQKEFFRLSSEIIARAHEQFTSCYPDLSNEVLLKRFDKLEKRIKLLRDLKTLQVIIETPSFNFENIILVYEEMPEEENKFVVHVHSFGSFPQATKKYFELEKENSSEKDIVLVRASSYDSVTQAFRNYFSDARDFVNLIEKGIEILEQRSSPPS